MLRLHIHGLTHGHDTDKYPYHVLVDRFMFVSHPCHVRHGLRAKFVHDDYFDTVKIIDMDKCPYQIRIAMPCPPCIPVVLGISLRKFAHGYGKDVRQTWHGRCTDILWTNVDWDGQIIMATDSIRMWREFDTNLIQTTLMISNFTPHFIMNVTTYPCWD